MAEQRERKVGQENGIYTTQENTQIKLRTVDTEAHLPKNVENWMQAVKKEVGNQNPMVRQIGAQVVTPAAATPKIVIPTTRASFSAGFMKAVSDAGRWFSTFWFRMMKIKKEEVVFKDDNV